MCDSSRREIKSAADGVNLINQQDKARLKYLASLRTICAQP